MVALVIDSYEFMRVVNEVAAEWTRPSVLHRPDLIENAICSETERYACGKWTLVTYGPTPAEAFRRFDQAFRGQPCKGFLGGREPREGEIPLPGHTHVNAYCTLPATHDGPCEDQS